MKTAIIYARAKADLSDFGLISVQGQFQTCKEYAEKNNIKVIGLFSDILLLGNKPKYSNWRNIVNTKKPNYDYILVYNNSRVGRDLKKVLKDRSKLKEKVVRIISASEPMSEDEADFFYTIMEAMNNVGNV